MSRKYSKEEIEARLDKRVSDYNQKVTDEIIIKYDNKYDHDEIGKEYNYLRIDKYIGKDKKHRYWFECICKCGRRTYKNLTDLKSNNTKSCGCHHVQIAIEHGKNTATHGLVDSKLYNIYQGMYKRCYNPSHKSYYEYGGNGIKICDEWLHDKTKFFRWALDNGYEEGLSIDRIDFTGNYCPENCRWADPKIQCNNRVTNIFLTVGFCTYTAAQWGEILNLTRPAVYHRIKKGWTAEEILFTPRGSGTPNIQNNKCIIIPEKYLSLNKYGSDDILTATNIT